MENEVFNYFEELIDNLMQEYYNRPETHYREDWVKVGAIEALAELKRRLNSDD